MLLAAHCPLLAARCLLLTVLRAGLPSKGEHLPRQVTAGAMEGAVIRMVAAGQNHSVALTEGGKVGLVILAYGAYSGC